MPHNVKPWRFVVAQDCPEQGLFRGDIITATAGQPTRVSRVLPINPGLLLNLNLQDIILQIDGVVGTEAAIVAAMEAPITGSPEPHPLRVLR